MFSNPTTSLPVSPRELVVVTRADAKVKVKDGEVTSDPNYNVERINALLKSPKLLMRPLFGLSEDRLTLRAKTIKDKTGITLADLTVFKRLFAPDDRLEELAGKLIAEEAVAGAYIKPGVSPAMLFADMVPPNLTEPVEPPRNFTDQQGYLNSADEGGIDARFAWTQPGGKGKDIKIIDVEAAWHFDHDDLNMNQGGTVAGHDADDIVWRNHGTAVLGIVSGDDNDKGITGICHEANISGVSIFPFDGNQGWGTAAAITEAANRLGPGDVLLLELQRPGPRVNFERQENEFGDIPVEWWPDDFQAIKDATKRGVIVITAAGNGTQDLSDALYDVRPNSPELTFPADWANPFRRGTRDSGSIIVGAGGPKINGITKVPNLCRMPFSNFDLTNHESILDAQGWGERVVTTGFGILEHGGGPDEKFWYTDRFSGTSSAAPMIAGALVCLQGIRRAQNKAPLTPSQARMLLRTTGREQQDDPIKSPAAMRIGNRPDLKALIEKLPSIP